MDSPPVLNNGARHDDEIHLRDVWNLLARNWLILGTLVVGGVGAAWAYSSYTVPVYSSLTTIRIEEERTDLPVLDVLQSLSTGSEVETEMAVVRSRTLAERVVDSLGLQVRISEPRGVARSELLGSIYVERWAPKGTYLLEGLPDGTFAITEQENQTSVGVAEIRRPAAVPGATFALSTARAAAAGSSCPS